MNPKEISVAPPASPAATVEQALLVVDPMDKREALRRLIRSEQVRNAIIFCNRKKDVDILHKSLVKHGFDAVALHGDMAQANRTKTLERFKTGEVQLLVASDVAARGLDVQGLSHVFNFDVPIHAEDYVHRIGRTGRAGLSGKSFTIAAPEDGRNVAAIITLIGKDIPMTEVEGIQTHALVYEDTRRGRGGRGAPATRRGESKRSEPKRSESPRPRARHAEPKPVEARPPEASRAEPVRAEAAREPDRRPRDRRPDPRRSDQRRPDDRPKAQPIRMTPEGMERGSNVTVLAEAATRRDGGRGRPDREDADDRRVVGFGDHLPAFLARPVKIAESR
jgi:superfamily II DNA/RNA helicase